MKHSGMAVVGLTGGIASGTSTVAGLMAARGAVVIDADQVAREVVAPGEPTLDAIRRAFGEGVIRADGTLDRAGLGAIVFADRSRLELLNRLTHPAILQRVAGRLVALQKAGEPWAVYEAALVLENGLAPGLGALVAVVCDPETQVARIVARNGLDEASARQRLAAQTDNATRREAADYVIENDGPLDALRDRTNAVVDALEARFGALPTRHEAASELDDA